MNIKSPNMRIATYVYDNGSEFTLELDFDTREYVVRSESNQQILKRFKSEEQAGEYCSNIYREQEIQKSFGGES